MSDVDINAQVPILGQPAVVKSVLVVGLVVCNCDAKTPMFLPMGAQSMCPGCKRKYVLALGSELKVGVGIVP
jgi:hypothetical protein